MKFQGALVRCLLASALAVASACASRGAVLDGLTTDELMELGIQHHAAGRYGDAVRIFERVTFAFGYARMDEARYYLADSYFRRGEYVSAAHEFTRLATDSPFSPYAVEARFKVCESYYRLSPRVELDQEYTRAGIESCNALVQYYPDSEFAPRARELSKELVDKLARKLFLTGENYFRNRFYLSAIIYYEDVLEEYPDTDVAPQALLRIIEAYLALGYQEDAEEAKARLLREYPGTEAADRAEGMSIAGDP